MKIEKYENTFTALPCTVNSAKKLGIVEALRLFQDIATEHAMIMGVDYDTLKENSNTFWAITKMKVHFYREPVMFEKLSLSSWPNSPSSLAGPRNFVISGEDGTPAIGALSEWVQLDIDTRRLRRFTSTCYPLDAEHLEETAISDSFSRFQCSFDENELVYKHIVRASDTDMSQHTNNTVYARLMLDAFTSEFFAVNRITDFEVRYAIESKEGDELSIYKKEDGKRYYLAVMNSAGKAIVTAVLDIA